MTLTKDQILATDDLPRQEVTIPEWNGSVYVRSLSGADAFRFGALLQGIMDDALGNAKLAALFAVDAEGQRLFADTDAEALAAKHYNALKAIVNAALRFNGFTSEGIADAGNA